jgi:eukaryotic-like serine/threonine-protein kinase
VERAIHFLRQLCGALHEAHAIGLIHRDIKPGNVIVCERGRTTDVAKLLDFGLVQSVLPGGEFERSSQRGIVVGTPAYLSPEQASGASSVDARSDIYSLGALAYFLLTGQAPFAGRSVVQMIAAHRKELAPSLAERRADLPERLQAIVLRCLAKDPAARFPDVRSLEAALAECLVAAPSEGSGR